MDSENTDVGLRRFESRGQPASAMQGVKRDFHGNARGPGQKKKPPPQQAERNAYTHIFESFRDELDEHYDRRERVVKVSRDVTALSKKMCVRI